MQNLDSRFQSISNKSSCRFCSRVHLIITLVINESVIKMHMILIQTGLLIKDLNSKLILQAMKIIIRGHD